MFKYVKTVVRERIIFHVADGTMQFVLVPHSYVKSSEHLEYSARVTDHFYGIFCAFCVIFGAPQPE